MALISISDAKDPRLAPYVAIRERDLTGAADGRFIVEGRVTLGILLTRSRFQVDSLFLCETRVRPLEDLLSAVSTDVPVFVAPQSVMDQVAGFPVHRGVLACARKGAPLEIGEVLDGARTVLLLAGISNHDNVGAAFRNAAAFGVDAVFLDGESCDPLYRKSIRVSAGTALWLPFVHGGAGEHLVSSVQAAGFAVWAMTPRADAENVYHLDRPDRLAILLGAEGPGLPDELIEAARPVRIAMAENFDSVNVATAGAIALSWLQGH